MFQKFKDKLAEEMKQSPARLQASMQQMAQAVISPAQSNSSIQELPITVESKDLTKKTDDSVKSNSVKNTFQNVELVSPLSNSVDASRRSSVNSVTSDVSSLFPLYESPKNLYHIQSDIDQSATEIDDDINTQLDRVTKDQLYLAYKKIQGKYNKYRGRYTDLVKHYRDLERVKTKLESVLVETQDNVLRRIGDLKEQCQLEQQAKAHLEEVLRNDIEERNHIIDTLNTKIKLLQGNTPPSENLMLLDNDEGHNSTVEVMKPNKELTENAADNSELVAENAILQNKIIKLEAIVTKNKNTLKRCENLMKRYKEILEENNILKRDYEALKSSSLENAEVLQKELSISQNEVSNLMEQVNTLKRREEESVISLAENKLSIHRELEGKEEQIKRLQFDLKHTMESKESLTEIVDKYKTELEQLKTQYMDTDKTDNIQDTSKGDAESIESNNTSKNKRDTLNENETLDKLKHDLTEKEEELQKIKVILQETQTLSKEYQCNMETLQNEFSNLKIKYVELKKEQDAQTIITNEKKKEAETTIEKLQMTVQSLDKELENMRFALSDRDQVCETFNLKMQEYASMLEKANNKLSIKDLEIKKLNDQLSNENEITKLNNTIENKDAELTELSNQLKNYKDEINNLTEQVDEKNSKIDLLNKEKISFKSQLLCFKTNTEKLKENCMYLRNNVKEIFQNNNEKISNLDRIINFCLKNTLMEKESLKEEVEILHTKLKMSEEQVNKLIEVETELVKIKQQKTDLMHELNEYKTKVKQIELERHDKYNIEMSRYIAEIDNLNSKIHDLQEIQALTEKKKEDEVEHLKREMIEFKKKYEDATNIIKTLENKKSECNLLQEELERLKSEIVHLHDSNTKNNTEINELRETILKKESEMADLEIRFQDHVKLVKEYAKKNEEIEGIYQDANKYHEEEVMKLNDLNNTLQKSLQKIIDTKDVELKKLQEIKEQQDKKLLFCDKRIEDLTVELDEFRAENLNMSQMIERFSNEIKTLEDENHLLEKLKTENELMNVELVELKSILNKFREENKNLKVKHSQLIQSHEELHNIKETLEIKELEYNKKKKDFLRDLEISKDRLNGVCEELKLTRNKLEETNAKVNSQTKALQKCDEELQKTKKELEEQTLLLSDKTTELTEHLKHIQSLEISKTELTEHITKLNEQLTNVKATNLNNIPFKHTNETLSYLQIKKLKNGELVLDEHLANLSASTVLNLDAENKRLMDKIKSIENIMEQKNLQFKLLETNEENLLKENEKLKLLNMEEELDQKIIEIDTLKTTIKEQENQINKLQSQIESLTDLKDINLQTADNYNTVEQNLVEGSNQLKEENKKLKAELDEALITFLAKESQMHMINKELEDKTGQLKEELKTHEEEQNIRLKQLVKEFQAQLQDKEEELQSALEKRFDYQQSYESNLLQQYKEQLKDFQVELTTKSEQLENLILENKKLTAEKENEVKALTESIASIRKEHVNELRETEQKWKTILQQRSDRLETKHEEEIKELTREWRNERKLDTNTDTATEELENTSCIAMAAIQSNTGSFHTFQQTLASQNRELTELRKLVKLRHETLEDSTEIEYLKNILYEYMMGKETMVLAKVIAAVVKFDQEQTAKILKKEEDKLTLLGSLGIT
ncbi:hypothetical protein M0804_000186 [Polistes exclamans]|nr:hypothetical protein M0804_000186 [Polistes exclamans]